LINTGAGEGLIDRGSRAFVVFRFPKCFGFGTRRLDAIDGTIFDLVSIQVGIHIYVDNIPIVRSTATLDTLITTKIYRIVAIR